MLSNAEILQIISTLTNTDLTKLETDRNLIEEGILDSITIVSLIMKLEELCECNIPNELYDIDHFITINSIVALTKQLKGD